MESTYLGVDFLGLAEELKFLRGHQGGEEAQVKELAVSQSGGDDVFQGVVLVEFLGDVREDADEHFFFGFASPLLDLQVNSRIFNWSVSNFV